MRKKSGILLLCVFAVLAGCMSIQDGSGASQVGSSVSVESSAGEEASAAPESSGSEETPNASEEDSILDDVQLDVQNWLMQLSERCQEIIDATPEICYEDSDGWEHYAMTSEHKQMLCDAVTDEGLSAFFDYRMVSHPEQALAFYQDYRDQEEGSHWTVCQVIEDGLEIDAFVYKRGKLWNVSGSVDFPGLTGGPMDPSAVRSRIWDNEVGTARFSPRGYLMIGEDDYWESYRVAYKDERLYEMKERYIDPIFYSHIRLHGVEWTPDDLTQIPWDFAFDALYGYEVGYYGDRDPPTGPLFSHPVEDYRYAVDAELYERVLTDYYPVTRAQLRSLDNYRPEEGIYAWQPYIGGGGPFEIEVIDYAENEDGSLTITAMETALFFGQDENDFAFALTVQERPDGGFTYLSNEILVGEPFVRSNLAYLDPEKAGA